MIPESEERTDRATAGVEPQHGTIMRAARPPSMPAIAGMLLAITFVVGGPSFLFAYSSGFDAIGMLVGVALVYALLYSVCATRPVQQWLRNRALARSIVTALVLRPLLFPISLFFDLFAGAIAMNIAGAPIASVGVPGSIGIADTLPTTLVQAVLGLTGFGLLTLTLYPLHRWGLMKKERSGLCFRCGYDLRATRDRCPECGMPVPEGHTPDRFLRDYNPGQLTEAAADAAQKD